MEKGEIKPLLIDFDEVEFRRDLHKLEERIIKAHGKKIEKAFEATGQGKLTNEYLQGILKGDLTEIRKDVVNMISKVLDPEYLSNEIANNVNSKLKSLEHATMDLHAAIDLSGLHSLKEYISVTGTGKLTVSKADEKRLKEYHCKYLTTKEGIRLYELHKEACKAMNVFVTEMGDRLGLDDPLIAFGYDDNGNVIPKIYDYE